MNDSFLIKKIKMECPICGKIHNVELRERATSLTIKNKDVKYKEKYYLCTNVDIHEGEFVSGLMMDENLSEARNEYLKLLRKNQIMQ